MASEEENVKVEDESPKTGETILDLINPNNKSYYLKNTTSMNYFELILSTKDPYYYVDLV